MNLKRRIFMKGTLAAGAVGVAVGAGLLSPRTVLAAWPEAAFKA
jgi:sulfur-oxidizing protein SoxY